MTSRSKGTVNLNYEFSQNYSLAPSGLSTPRYTVREYSDAEEATTKDASGVPEGGRRHSGIVTLLVILVVALYVLIILQVTNAIFPSSTSPLYFYISFTALGVGGALAIVFGMRRLFRRIEAGEAPPEQPMAITEAPAKPEQKVEEEGAAVPSVPQQPTVAPPEVPPEQREAMPTVGAPMGLVAEEEHKFPSIHERQKAYGQRVTELLTSLQSAANTIVQIPTEVFGSAYLATYLTSDAVILMFDRSRNMTSKPLRDFPTDVIVSVVNTCTPKLKKSILDKKQEQTNKVHSLEGAVKQLEDALADVEREN